MIAGTSTALVLVGAGPATADGPYAVSATIAIEGTPTGMAINTATDTGYVASNVPADAESGGELSVIDLATNTVTATVRSGSYPKAVAVDPTTNTIYVATVGNDGADYVLAFDGATMMETAFIYIDQDPTGIAVDPSTHTVYVADGVSVEVIDGTTNTVTKTIGTGGFRGRTGDLGWDADNQSLYVANAGQSNTVAVIDGSTQTLDGQIRDVGVDPAGVAINAATGTVYVAAAGGDEVAAIDTATNDVTANDNVGSSPEGVAVDAATDTVYVANSGDDSVSVLDGSDADVRYTVPVGHQPGTVAVDPDSHAAYVVNTGDDTVSVITGVAAPTIGGQPPAATSGVRYSYQFLVDGNPAPTESVTGGILPPGLSLTSSGLLSGTPRAAGRWSFVVTASNGVGQDASEGVTISVAPGAHRPLANLAVSLAAPGGVRHGRALTATVTVTDTGPDSAQAVTTTLVVPQGLTVTRAGGGIPVRSGLRFVQRGVARGSRRTYVVTLVAARGARGPRQLIAQTGSATADPNPRNNSATATVRIR